MYNILTLNKIAKCGTDKFGSAYICGDSIENPDAIMVRSAAMHDMALSDKTVAIARAGAGVNNIPVDSYTQQGVVVFNTPGANANAVKELVIAALFMSSRKIAESVDWCKTLKGEGDNVAKLVEKGKSAFAGPEIMGKTLGIVGLGAIGALVANAAAALGMSIVGYDPYLNPNAVLPEGIKIVTELDELFALSDYITLHVPLNDGTKNTVSAASLAKMKDGVRILNFARGELVNSDDILAALESGKASAYITDFPTDAQIAAKGVTAIPHLGASTPESEDNCAMMAAVELAAYLEKGEIVNSVNMPAMKLAAPAAKRTCVIHSESALAAVTAKLAECGAANVTTASKKGISYTVADGACDAVSAVDGVIRVRVI